VQLSHFLDLPFCHCFREKSLVTFCSLHLVHCLR